MLMHMHHDSLRRLMVLVEEPPSTVTTNSIGV
jgi:hypothetical protein